MDKDKITPERADEILGHVKEMITNIKTPDKLEELCLHLEKEFPELKGLKHKFDTETLEKIDRLLALFAGEFVERGNFDLASEIMDQINEEVNINNLAKKFKEKYPIEFENALEKLAGGTIGQLRGE